jgi:hypothetical protein
MNQTSHQTRQSIRGNILVSKPFQRKSEVTQKVQNILDMEIPSWVLFTVSCVKERWLLRLSVYLGDYSSRLRKHICMLDSENDLEKVIEHKNKITSIIKENTEIRNELLKEKLKRTTRYAIYKNKKINKKGEVYFQYQITDKVKKVRVKCFSNVKDSEISKSNAQKYVKMLVLKDNQHNI